MTEAFLEAHNKEITILAGKFSSYFISVDRTDIRAWLKLFNSDHLNIALKLLKAVDFYDPPRITTNFRTAHRQFLAAVGSSSLEDVAFFPFGRAGKSGNAMIYHYRTANNIPQAKCKYFSEIPMFFRALEEEPQKELKLVFIDDFVGTGSQAIGTWELLREIPFPQESRVFLLTLAGFRNAIDKVMEKTDLQVITPRPLFEEDRVFSPDNTVFDSTEQEILRVYCEEVGQDPTGFRNCQALVVFYYKSPDDVISILRGQTEDWTPLFPRSLLT